MTDGDGVRAEPEHDFWVFAYGSLIWNPGFAYKSREAARLRGYHRRYCIQSKIYRGTAEAPGLVLGLEKGGDCEGIAYAVAGELRSVTMDYLRERELLTSVYHETVVGIETRDGDAHDAYTYVADPLHEQYVRIDDVGAIVDIIRAGRGDRRDQLRIRYQHLVEFRPSESVIPLWSASRSNSCVGPNAHDVLDQTPAVAASIGEDVDMKLHRIEAIRKTLAKSGEFGFREST